MHVDRGNTTPAYLTVDGKYHKAFLGIQLSFLVDSLCGFSVPQNRYGIFLLLLLPERKPRDTKCPISLSHMNSQFLRVLTCLVDSYSFWNTCKKYSRTDDRLGPFSTARQFNTCNGDCSFSCAMTCNIWDNKLAGAVLSLRSPVSAWSHNCG